MNILGPGQAEAEIGNVLNPEMHSLLRLGRMGAVAAWAGNIALAALSFRIDRTGTVAALLGGGAALLASAANYCNERLRAHDSAALEQGYRSPLNS
jgi:hypothetical protein